MADPTRDRDERRRVLDLLERGEIDADGAAALLRLIGVDGIDPRTAGERSRILGLLEEGVLKPEQAIALLRSLGADRPRPAAPGGPAATAHVAAARAAGAADAGRRGVARMLRITIDASEAGEKDTRVRVNVPLGLARFASRFLPHDAREQLEEQGIDLAELLGQVGDDLPDGPLVDIDAASGTTDAKILIEVV